MKKIIKILLVVLIVILAFAAFVACNKNQKGTTPVTTTTTTTVVPEEIPACEHTGGEATCAEAAVCELCGESYGDKIEHTVEYFEDEYHCEEKGMSAGASCIVCGTVIIDRLPLNPTGHNMTEGSCTEDSVCLNEGCDYVVTAPGHTYVEGICACGAEDSGYVPPHVHTYETVVTAPTCIEVGYTIYTCECGDTYMGDEVVATGHIDNNGDYKCDTCSTIMLPKENSVLTVEQALAVAKAIGNTYTTEKYYITGAVANAPDVTWGNFYLEGENGNQILIYGLYSADGSIRYDAMTSKPLKGDEITVLTVLGCYNGTPQAKNAWMYNLVKHTEHIWIDATCQTPKTCSVCEATEGELLDHEYIDGVCKGCGNVEGAAALVNATISFFDKSNRTDYSTSIQVWEQNGVKVTNNKLNSTSDVADYANPARFYASSNLVIEAVGISKIVFDTNSNTYATVLKNSIGTVSGATVTVINDKVTVEFNSPVDSFTIAKFTGQVRMDSITIN